MKFHKNIFFTIFVVLLLSACGGGSGGSGGSGGGSAHLSKQTVEAEVSLGGDPNDSIDSFVVTLSGTPSAVTPYVNYDVNIISEVTFVILSQTEAEFFVTFNSAIDWFSNGGETGVFNSAIELYLCYDDSCSSAVGGSPYTIAVNYKTTGASVSLDEHSMSLSYPKMKLNENKVEGKIQLTKKNLPEQYFIMQDIFAKETGIIDVGNANIVGDKIEVPVHFDIPTNMPIGTTEGQVQLKFCYDFDCNKQVDGSPVTIPTLYHVYPPTELDASVSATDSTVAVRRDKIQTSSIISKKVDLVLDGLVRNQVYITLDTALDVDVSYLSVSQPYYGGTDTKASLEFSFRQAKIGKHTRVVTANVCYDSNCKYHVAGSPVNINTDYVVTAGLAKDEVAANIISRKSLSRNIVDAEYSEILDAIVMVSSAPENALYVYQVESGTENKIPLTKKPTAVSVAPSGTRFAVGHDTKVSVIDYDENIPNDSITTLLDVSHDVFDLVVMDGYVYMVSIYYGFPLTKIEIATNTESNHTSGGIGNPKIKLHPSGKSIYSAYRNELEKIDVETSPAAYHYSSIFNNLLAVEMCGDLWLGKSGETMYTRCGSVFRLSDAELEDMLYDGKLIVSDSGEFRDYEIASLAESSSGSKLVTSELKDECSVYNYSAICQPYIRFHNKDSLESLNVYRFLPIENETMVAEELPMHVFYNAAGTRVFVLSVLDDNEEKSYLLEVKE